MTIQSNLYVEKVSSEHPIAVWMLNDQLDYISLITETERAIENTANWTVTNATASLSTTDPDNVPFIDSHITKLLGNVPGATTDIVIESDFFTNLSEFNTALDNVAVSGNLYVKSIYANSISFGYKYFNGVSTVEVLTTKTLGIASNLNWVFFSDTFDIPPTGATNIQLLFKINISAGGGTTADYEFYLNGITFGQWSEEFNKSSLGLTLSDYSPPTGFIPGLSVVPAIPYGVSDENAYYVVGTKDLYAKNFGVPIVYGSSNVTKLYYNSAGPSLVFPGYGFLNQKGKFNTYTAEMWVKINADTAEPHRIFGPAFSNDGLYIEGPFLTFVLGKQYASHYIGEWYRPMLIHIRYIQNNLSVLLNGEQIINIPFIENDLTLPNEFDGAVNQDWLAFYAHPDITPLEIDSFAIYSYSVANEVAKRRWVWGQGVVAPEQTGSALNAVTSFNDYTYSDYSVNYNYPDQAKWDQAFFTNIAATSRSLELPSYSLPTLNLGTKTLQELYDDNQNIVLPTTTRTNLVRNPNFEINTTWWSTSSSTITRITTDSYIGTACCQVSKSAVANGRIRSSATASDRIPVTAGTAYRFSAYVKVPTGQPSCSLRIRTTEWQADGTRNSDQVSSTTVVADTQGWVRLSLSDTPTAGATPTVTMTIEIEETSANARTYLVDAVMVEQSSTLNPYFDGSYSQTTPTNKVISTSWTGTANASTSTEVTYTYQDDADGYKFFTLKPSAGWNSINSTAYFSEYGFLPEAVESVYGMFASDGTATNQLLFKLENKRTKEYLKAVLNSTTITYSAKLNGMTTAQTLATKTITANQRFVAGINISTLSQKVITSIKKFLSNEASLAIYLFGDGVDNTFSGRIYSFNFDSKYNNRKLSGVSYSDGFFDTTLATANIVLAHTPNYGLGAFEKYGLFFLDIACAGYWQDYMPLTYFGKYVTDFDGVQHYDLDMIQFNIDYPEPIETEAVTLTQAWTYDDMYIWFRQDSTRTYASLDSVSYTGWNDYAEMEAQTTDYDFYNTDDNDVRSYVTFQPILDGANQSLLDFTNVVQARTNAIVDTNTLIGDWETSAYEVVDGSVIFPPSIDKDNQAVDFNNYAIVYHLDFNVKGILHKKARVRSLQLASQVLERASFTEMGTKFAVPVYPFSKTGIYYNFKGKNYTSTYKGSTPHLYLNRHSGWRIRKGSDDLIERGISIPINFQEAAVFEIKGVQMWMRYSDIEFPSTETRVFSLEHNNGVYDFYVIADSSTQRGLIYGKDRLTDAALDGVEYYINGIVVDKPYLINQEWAVLGIQFPTNVSFNSDVGRLNLNGPFTYNNVSAYLITNLERAQTIVYRTWGQVDDQTWDYWENTYTWDEVFVISATDVGILNFGDIYQKYVGTNRIIVDDPTRGVLVNPERLRFYGDVLWRSQISTPV